MNRYLILVACGALTAGALAWACSEDDSPTPDPSATSSSGSSGTTSGMTSSGTTGTSGDPAPRMKAKAALAATTDGGTASGTAEFVEEGSTMTVTVNVSSGGAAGEHGLHVHANGSCDATDAGAAQGAGGHWNPEDAGHGYPGAAVHHLGDLGNITIDETGKGTLKLTFPVSKGPYVHEGTLSVVNHAVVYHAFKDDGVSQPVGDAGARPGCGVIVME